VITDDRGRVVVMDPDGSNADVLTEADGLSYFQPTWSPDGDLIAAGHGGGSENGLVVIDTTNGGFDVAPSVGVPFYFFWSPDSAKLAFLNNGSDGRLELNLRDVAGATTDRFGTGAPFYFSWSPDGESIATHIGTDIMDIRSLGGDTESLAAPGVFQAPQWTDRGLFHIGLTGDTQRLLLTAGETGSLGEVRGRTIFSATRDGSRIAVSSFSDQDGVSIAARPGRLTQTEQVLPANRLIVLDVESGEWKTVTTEPVAAFFWSPNGSRLLVLGRGDLELSVEWSVWDGQLTGYGSFVPSPSFIQNLVPFFDQYAQSFTLWSPDGGSFAYPAATDGDPGIWIQKVEGGDPTRVGNGSWVSWSSG
jgi:TolB protein